MSEPAADPNIVIAKRLFAGALGFFKAAGAINKIEGFDHGPAFLVNGCYAIELSSKAFLVYRGASDRRLRQIGHDLIAGLDAAVVVGYEPADPGIAKLIATLSPHHQGHSIRYLTGDETVAMPEPDEILAMIGAHLVGIGEQMPAHPTSAE
jgi:hypothetical protein